MDNLPFYIALALPTFAVAASLVVRLFAVSAAGGAKVSPICART